MMQALIRHVNWFKGLVAFLFLLSNVFQAVADPARAIDPRLDDFLKSFDAPRLEDDVLHLRPWRNYLAVRFEEELNAKFRSKYFGFQDAGECLAVTDLDQYGFTQMYSFLEPVFVRDDIRVAFIVDVALRFSDGYTRCMALSEIREATSSEYLNESELIAVDSLEDTGRSWRYANHENVLTQPVTDLVNLAVCKDYSPAIVDLLSLFEDRQWLRPYPIMEFYLSERAIQLGLSQRNETIARIARLRFSAQVRYAVDVAAFEPNDVRINALFYTVCSQDYNLLD